MAAMTRLTLAVALPAAVWAILPAAATAQPAPGVQPAPGTVRTSYAAYAKGLNILNLDAEYAITPRDYRVRLAHRTAGALSALFRGEQETRVEGRFVGERPAPTRFFSAGQFRGQPRVTQIDYPGGTPVVRQLQPPNEQEREPVPEAMQAGTVDTVSAVAQLVRQVNLTGRCEGRSTTFDGRRLSALAVRTAGQEVLESTSRSSYSGPALRCEIEGRLLAGFRTDAGREEAARPRRGSAWFARLQPDGPLVPVRFTFEAPFAGSATAYLVASPP